MFRGRRNPVGWPRGQSALAIQIGLVEAGVDVRRRVSNSKDLINPLLACGGCAVQHKAALQRTDTVLANTRGEPTVAQSSARDQQAWPAHVDARVNAQRQGLLPEKLSQ